MLCLFFQAEDGIRDGHVTGVQTCALPIYPARVQEVLHELSYTAQRNVASRSRLVDVVVPDLHSSWMNQLMTGMHAAARERSEEASCRERGESEVGTDTQKETKRERERGEG